MSFSSTINANSGKRKAKICQTTCPRNVALHITLLLLKSHRGLYTVRFWQASFGPVLILFFFCDAI